MIIPPNYRYVNHSPLILCMFDFLFQVVLTAVAIALVATTAPVRKPLGSVPVKLKLLVEYVTLVPWGTMVLGHLTQMVVYNVTVLIKQTCVVLQMVMSRQK